MSKGTRGVFQALRSEVVVQGHRQGGEGAQAPSHAFPHIPGSSSALTQAWGNGEFRFPCRLISHPSGSLAGCPGPALSRQAANSHQLPEGGLMTSSRAGGLSQTCKSVSLGLRAAGYLGPRHPGRPGTIDAQDQDSGVGCTHHRTTDGRSTTELHPSPFIFILRQRLTELLLCCDPPASASPWSAPSPRSPPGVTARSPSLALAWMGVEGRGRLGLLPGSRRAGSELSWKLERAVNPSMSEGEIGAQSFCPKHQSNKEICERKPGLKAAEAEGSLTRGISPGQGFPRGR